MSSFLGLASCQGPFHTRVSMGIPAPSSVDRGFLAGKMRLCLQQALSPVEPPCSQKAGLRVYRTDLLVAWFPRRQGLGLWPLPELSACRQG